MTRGESTRRNRVEFCSYKMNESCLIASAERAMHTNNDQFLSQIGRLFFLLESTHFPSGRQVKLK